VLTVLSASAATSVVQVGRQAECIDLSGATSLLEDPEGKLTLDDVRSPDYIIRFQPGSPMIGYTRSAYWIRMALHNPTSNDVQWWLDTGDRLLQEIALFAPETSGVYRRQSASSADAFEKRPLRTPTFVFPIVLPARETVEVYLRVRMTGNSQIGIHPRLWNPEAFQIKQQHNRLSWSYYLGMSTALGILNLLLFFAIRERVNLIYVISILAHAGSVDCNATGFGLLFADLWPNSPTFNQIAPLGSVYFAFLASSWFVAIYVNLPKIAPTAYRIGRWCFLACGLLLCVAFLRLFPQFEVTTSLAQACQRAILISMALIGFGVFWVLVEAARAGNRASCIVLIAWSPTITLGVIVSWTSVFPIYIDWPFPPVMVGSGYEIVMMSLALVDRIIQERKEKAQAQTALVQGLRQSERELEIKVEQRTSEVKAQAAQLDEWNHKLEHRVREQVNQIDRLGRLRRFFSPQLAEAIVAEGEEALKTHRREVSVVFLDLRGFTAFTDRAEPEEVIEMLHAFHGKMGRIVMEHSGTLERFSGDSIMIFFNDPVPIANHAEKAVHMALAMQEAFSQLSAEWRQRGYELGLGCGIALGYATLGEIGFEGRWDYAAIGGVTNLAARLCAEARGGQVLVDQKVMGKVESLVHASPVGPLALKGIAQPVPAFSLTGLNSRTCRPGLGLRIQPVDATD